jgi:glycosyltransferase involved in cell wall biosynthesis
LSVLEAMSCGCPVVVTDMRGFDALVAHHANGIKVRVGKPEELARGIREAYRLRRDLGRAARASVLAGFSDSTTYASLASTMRECLGAQGVSSS